MNRLQQGGRARPDGCPQRIPQGNRRAAGKGQSKSWKA